MEAFEAGIICAFDLWDLLTIAIDMGWAGPPNVCADKKKALINEVMANFERGKEVYVDELEDFFQDRVMSDFNTMAEDGSCQWLARLCCTLYQDVVVKGDCTGLTKILAANKKKPVVQGEGGADSDCDYEDGEGDEEMKGDTLNGQMGNMTIMEEKSEEVPAEPEPPKIDEDGFETVTRTRKKKGRGRRNQQRKPQLQAKEEGVCEGATATVTETVTDTI